MSSTDSTEGGEPLVFGVPGRTVAAALRDAGLDEDAVVAVLGRAITRSATPRVPARGFTFQVGIAETAPECALTYQRLFVHPDFIDGVTVVQAGQTPDEMGFNARFHALEAELDGISRDLQISSNCAAELRREIFLMARELEAKISDIDRRIDAKGKDKDTKDTKEKDTKESKDKDTKEKDTKESKDKEGKDTKDTKEKDRKEKDRDKALPQEKLIQGAEKNRDVAAFGAAEPIGGSPTGTARTFISLEDRPDVEAAAFRDEDDAPATAPLDPSEETADTAETAETAEPAKPGETGEPAQPGETRETAPKKAAAKATPAKATPAKAPGTKATPRKAAPRKAPPRKAAPGDSPEPAPSPPRRRRGRGSGGSAEG
ncbi:MAG TPA: hypothetical protein VF657_22905 [Actinoplanes sp.]